MTIQLGGPLLLVGAGKMGGAMLEGWIARGLAPKQIVVQEPSPPAEVAALASRHGFTISPDAKLATPPSVMVLAVKPQIMDEVLAPLKGVPGSNTVILSIAAGRTIASIARHLGAERAIVRSMPNTPASIGRGITVACANKAVTPAQKNLCSDLLAAVGEVEWVEDESALDPVTAVSGSGPAYVFLLAECLAEAGVKAGLDARIAAKLARETVAGAGEMLHRSKLDPAELRRNVTSPQGTTAAALEVLMGKDGLASLMERAVAAATKRSRELSS